VADGSRENPGESRPAPRAVISRVSLYLRQLEALQRQGHSRTSSGQLGQSLGINDAQVRKDLAYFGPFGHPGIGYRIDELIPALRRILGIDRTWPTALIGLGDLGRALLRYKGFRGRGFQVVALFDTDARKIGQTHAGLTILPLERLPDVATRLGLRLAIITVPADAAQAVADLAVSSGISGLLNFAPAPLIVPECVSIESVDLSVQLEQLSYKVLNPRAPALPLDDPPPPPNLPDRAPRLL
jgi:redox-sensing transcriptional repressor